ncbi:hypothetical protein A0H81_03684 [Grifola frondosa]|uniref:Uncharacterized protein n=1 Tax=Grifola frondosa TaxID=5627 RepID=A0A1C7MH33_GRIFR|nr:hypothetical protein A0H81_03684 [Grifola frondosa]
MSLLDNPSFKNISAPIRSASLPTEAYVLYLASLPSYYAAASSAPTNAIHLFDKSRLQVTQTLPGHESSITALRSVPNFANAASQVLVSCGKDGAVKAWDERAGVIGLHMLRRLIYEQ